MVIYYFSELKYLEELSKEDLLTSELVNAVADGLRKNKAHWDMNTKWVGQANKGGLWGAVRGINRMLYKDYNLAVLPEEL